MLRGRPQVRGDYSRLSLTQWVAFYSAKVGTATPHRTAPHRNSADKWYHCSFPNGSSRWPKTMRLFICGVKI